MRELDAQRPAGKLQMLRDLDQRAQRDAFQRDRMTPPQCVYVDPMAEIGSDHRQTGEAAFGRLGLQDYRQPGAPPEIQVVLVQHHSLLWNSESRIQPAKE